MAVGLLEESANMGTIRSILLCSSLLLLAVSISVFKWFRTTFVLYCDEKTCAFPVLPLLLSPVPQDDFLLPLAWYSRSPEVRQWWCSSFACVQLKGYFLVVSRSFSSRLYFFSLLSCLHVFHGSKYPTDMQFDEDRVLDKVSDMGQCPTRRGCLWCHLLSGTAFQRICCGGPEYRGAWSFAQGHFFLGKG